MFTTIELLQFAEVSFLALQILVIVVSARVALSQLKEERERRENDRSLALLESFQNIEYCRGLNLVYDLSDEEDPRLLDELPFEQISSMHYLLTVFESIGALVYRDELDIDLVEELFSGAVLNAWKKLRPWLIEERKHSNDNHYEWFQWLAELIAERETDEKLPPAYLRKDKYRGFKKRRRRQHYSAR